MKLFDRTEQEIFNDVVAHARKQGRKSLDMCNEFEYCAYRSNGGKCFIGALISDEDYDLKIEGRTVAELSAEFVGNPTNKQLGLASALQNAHDQYDVALWESRFAEIAKEFDLIYTPPQEIGNEAI